ncbi:MAG TPA: hypothetical protein IGS17_12155 [Oscillatoriales cyanobacterium M59_W2019_021]|nr:hypothetical protein [Oscillatoriales cyanobacterium M4454_W2019_049]HIK51655.1 hypothetical protein [Oscillatoriales cyanobacterium M59_W2019_021]
MRIWGSVGKYRFDRPKSAGEIHPDTGQEFMPHALTPPEIIMTSGLTFTAAGVFGKT